MHETSFPSDTDDEAKCDRKFAPGKPFQPSQLFKSKERTYPSEHLL